MTDFDPDKEIEELKQDSKLRRKRSYKQRQSKLDKHHAELEALRQRGATIVELTRWLSKKKRVLVTESTVHRWLKNKGIYGKV